MVNRPAQPPRTATFGAGRPVPPAYREMPVFHLQEGAVYGPILTRRKGWSLGVNLLPTRPKVCSFDCVYCQCDWTPPAGRPGAMPAFPDLDTIIRELEEGFARAGPRVDVITIAGNGEPTLHPRFGACVDAALAARDRHLPGTPVGVLSNGTELAREDVLRALDRLDQRCMKLDAGTNERLRRIAVPLAPFDLDLYERHLARLRDVTLQSCFLRGRYDNTTEEEVGAWLERVARIHPLAVQIYPIARVPAAAGLEVVPRPVLESIAARVRALGIRAAVAPNS